MVYKELFRKEKTCAVFLSSFSINLLVFFYKCHSLIGYAAHYLFCDKVVVQQCTLCNKIKATSWHFRSVYEEDLEKVLNY